MATGLDSPPGAPGGFEPRRPNKPQGPDVLTRAFESLAKMVDDFRKKYKKTATALGAAAVLGATTWAYMSRDTTEYVDPLDQKRVQDQKERNSNYAEAARKENRMSNEEEYREAWHKRSSELARHLADDDPDKVAVDLGELGNGPDKVAVDLGELGSALAGAGEYAAAIKQLTKDLNKEWNDPLEFYVKSKLYLERGRAHLGMGNTKEAVRDFTEADVVEPNVMARYETVKALQIAGKTNEWENFLNPDGTQEGWLKTLSELQKEIVAGKSTIGQFRKEINSIAGELGSMQPDDRYYEETESLYMQRRLTTEKLLRYLDYLLGLEREVQAKIR